MTIYNMSFVDTNTTLLQWMQGVDKASNGAFIGLALLTLLLVVYISFKSGQDIGTTLLVTSTVMLLVSSLVMYIGWISDSVWFIFIAFFMANLIFTWFIKDKG